MTDTAVLDAVVRRYMRVWCLADLSRLSATYIGVIIDDIRAAYRREMSWKDAGTI